MNNKILTISKKQSDSLYRSFKYLHDILTKHKISYFLIGGSLLGAIRHSGLIPWDDDGDIGIFEKDKYKLKRLVKKINRSNKYILWEPSKQHYKSKLEKEDLKTKKHCKKYHCSWIFENITSDNIPSIDIFIFKKPKGKSTRIKYSDPGWEKAENGGKRCYFDSRFTFPLVPKLFGNFYVMIPNNPVDHLNRCYSTNWNNKAKIQFDHIDSGKEIPKKLIILNKKDFLPLKPPKDTCSSKVPNINNCN